MLTEPLEVLTLLSLPGSSSPSNSMLPLLVRMSKSASHVFYGYTTVAGAQRVVAFDAGDSNSAVGDVLKVPLIPTSVTLMPPLLVLRTRYVSLGTVTSILADARLIRSKKFPNLLAVTTVLSPSWCVVYSIRSGCRRLALTTASPAIPEMMVMLPLHPLISSQSDSPTSNEFSTISVGPSRKSW